MPLDINPDDYNNFRRSLAFALRWEGGYVNDPDDPGGETRWGISKRAYPDVDIKNLTAEKAAELYYRDYWLRSGCSNVDFPLCTCIFDTAINCGVSRAVRWSRDATTSQDFLATRERYYLELCRKNPKLQKYLKGWLNRLNDLRKFVQIAEQSDQT